MTLNLSAPPNFKGLNQYLPVRRYERHLQHWRQDGATYFATFNLADAIPANKQREIESIRRDWEHKHPPPRDEQGWKEYAKRVHHLVERVLDSGYGKCWFCNQRYVDELQRAILHFHGKHYEIGCYVIMANRCHLTMRPFDEIEIEDELGAIKRTTTRFINQREGSSGPLWTQESYDRIIRDEEHLYGVVQYIGANPIKAQLPPKEWHRWINPEWENAGWKFDDIGLQQQLRATQ